MKRLILIRHGQSVWNLENRFTGWTDVDLTPEGEAQAARAGRLLSDAGIGFDAAFVSVLKRAVKTLHILEDACGLDWIEETRSWRLNERHYGALQGLDKAQTAEKYGEEQVRIWRRSYSVRPPLIKPDDPRSPALDPKYSLADPRTLPLGESLADAVARVLPFWQDAVAPALMAGKTPIVAAHGNSLRGLVKYLDRISDDDIPGLEIPTGVPLIYELDGRLEPVSHYYLE